MADTSTSMDVEDVLSSIRRLVSEEAKGPAPRETLVLSNPAAELEETPDFPDDAPDTVPDPAPPAEADLHDPLVLTPALQVVSPSSDQPDDLEAALDLALYDSDAPEDADVPHHELDNSEADDPVDVMIEAPDQIDEPDESSASGKSLWGFATSLRGRRKAKVDTAPPAPEEPLTVRRHTPRPAAISLEELIAETTGRALVSGQERLRRKREQASESSVVPLSAEHEEPMAYDDQAESKAKAEAVDGVIDLGTDADQVHDQDLESVDDNTPVDDLTETIRQSTDELDVPAPQDLDVGFENDKTDPAPMTGEILESTEPEAPASDDGDDPVQSPDDRDWSAVLATAMADNGIAAEDGTETTASGKTFEPVPDDIWDRARNVAAQQGADPMLKDGDSAAVADTQTPPADDMILPEGALDPRDFGQPEVTQEAEPKSVDQDLTEADNGEEGYIDEEALREMVVAILREELRGELGDRITHNVRKLVRREINRALTAQDFE